MKISSRRNASVYGGWIFLYNYNKTANLLHTAFLAGGACPSQRPAVFTYKEFQYGIK